MDQQFGGKLCSALVLATALLSTHTVFGAGALVDFPEEYFTTRGFDEAHGDGMVGYTFVLPQVTTITGIGWYDAGKDGLSRAFRVGLWSDDSNNNFAPGSPVTELLGTAGQGITIPGGTTAALNGIYRVVDLSSPLVLQPGRYQIAGLDTATTTDPIRYFWDMMVEPSPYLQIGQFFYTAHTGGIPGNPFRPTESNRFYLAGGYQLGPMLFIPEPSAFMLAGLAFGTFIVRRRR